MRDYTSKVNDTAPLASGTLDATEFNSFANELENAVTVAGIALDGPTGPDTSAQMLAQSMTRHASGALWCGDGGTANNYVVSMFGNFVPPAALFAGLTVRFYPGNNNTGASTCNAFGLGVKAIVNHLDAPLASGSLDGRVIELIYDPAIGAGSWVLPAWANALYVAITPIDPATVTSGEGVEVDLDNEVNLNFTGLANDSNPLAGDRFAFHDAADAVHKNITYAQLVAALGTSTGGLLGVQYITTSGTYTKTAGTQKAIVFATGGGGGGGAGRGFAEAGGGGGGGTAIAFVDLSSVSTVTATIGAGGAGGVAANGSSGGTTSFGSHASATGGQPGTRPGSTSVSSIGHAGIAGVGTAGLMLLAGNSGSAAAADDARSGGNGGGSFWGGGGRGGVASNNSSPEGGRAPGAGGGGGDGTSTQLQSDQNGGAGAPGCILVLEFA